MMTFVPNKVSGTNCGHTYHQIYLEQIYYILYNFRQSIDFYSIFSGYLRQVAKQVSSFMILMVKQNTVNKNAIVIYCIFVAINLKSCSDYFFLDLLMLILLLLSKTVSAV